MSLPFSWKEWSQLSAVQLSEHVRRAEVTAEEIFEQATAAARALEPELGALVEVLDAPWVPKDVAAADPARGSLAGVPLFLKDLGSSVAGLKRELGSALHRGETVARTDPLTEAWLKEGARVAGRATTAELGMAYDTTTVYNGLKITRNPWGPRYTAGGSSGGSAALVAAAIAPAAHATDGAGSIRIPAAFNGLVGLKVTRGRLAPLWGANELSNASFVEGVISRSLEDTALFLDAATRWPAPPGAQYVAVPHDPTRSLAALKERLPTTLKVGVTTALFRRTNNRNPEPLRVVRHTADALARAGHQVDEIAERDLPNWDDVFAAFATLWLGVRVGSWNERGAALSARALAGLSPVARRYHEQTARYQKADILHYLGTNPAVTRAFAGLFERYDVLLLPTFPYLTPLANGLFSSCQDHDFNTFSQNFLDAGRYTIPASLTGLPALSLPAGFDERGLPLGVQLYGRWRGEVELLSAGKVVQQVLELPPVRPQLHVTRLEQ